MADSADNNDVSDQTVTAIDKLSEEIDPDVSRGSTPGSEDIIERSNSAGSSCSDASVAVNCAAFPSEVVVQGRGVQKVRVLFTPLPPPPKVTSSGEPRLRTHRKASALRSTGSTHKSTSLSTQVAESEIGHELLPLPTEETDMRSLLPGCQLDTSGLTRVTSLPDAFTSTVGSDHALPVSFSTHSLPEGDLDVEVDPAMERHIIQESVNALKYLERRTEKLRAANKRLHDTVELLSRDNERIKEAMLDADRRQRATAEENDELKNKLDRFEKENMILSENHQSEWKLRVEAEEKLVEERRKGELEITALKEEMDRQNNEIKLLECLIQNNNNNNNNNVNNADDAIDKKNFLDEKNLLELVHRSAELDAMMAEVQLQRDRWTNEVAHLQRESALWKERYEAKCREFDAQVSQYETLRRTFGHLRAENNSLRSQFTQVKSLTSLPSPAVTSAETGSSVSLNSSWTAKALQSQVTRPSGVESSTKQVDAKAASPAVTVNGTNGAQLHRVQLPLTSPPASASTTAGVKLRPDSKDASAVLIPIHRSSQVRIEQRRKKSDVSISGASTSSVDTLPPVVSSAAQHQIASTKFSK